jgi:hypothetical protein
MPERPRSPLDSSGIHVLAKCYNCDSKALELVQAATAVMAASPIYRCKQCGHVDWLELPRGAPQSRCGDGSTAAFSQLSSSHSEQE